MSEAVEVIISADDQASAKFAQVAVNAEKDLTKVKTAGEKLKGMAGVGGVLTRMLGGTELGGQIAQIGEITEKVNQFGQVAKMGGAAANVFRAGVAGLVAVMSVQLGESIGKVIFGTDKFEKQLEAAREASQRLNEQLLELGKRDFSSRMADISIIGDPNEQVSQLRMLYDELAKQDDAAAKKRASKLGSAGAVSSLSNFLDKGAQKNNFILEANQIAESQNQLRDQQRSIIDLMAEKSRAITQSFNTSLDALNEERILLTEGEAAAEKFRLSRSGMTNEMISWIQGVKAENAEMKKANAEKEKAAQLAARVSESYANAAGSIQKQRIAFEQGEEAGRKFELMQQGMSDAMAERIAEEEAQLRLDNQRRDSAKQVADSLKLQRLELEQGTDAARAFALEQSGLTAEEAKKFAAEEQNLRKRQIAKDAEKEALDNLRMRRIEVQQGAEAARRAALIEKGVGDQQAGIIAAEEAALERQARIKDSMKGGIDPLQAKESRLLSRGTESQLGVSKEQLATLNKIADTLQEQKRERRLNLVPVVRG